MWKNTKIMSKILIAAMLCSVMGYCNMAVNAKEAAEEKQYIIVMENDETYDEVEEEIGDNIMVETPVLSENNIIVAELTEKEAVEFDQDNNITIEEDIIICASTTEEEEEFQLITELTIEEIQKKRAEIKCKKKELYEESLAKEELEDIQAECEWNLQAINAEEVIEEEKQSGQKVKVAVLDSGIDYVTGINLMGYVNFVEENEEEYSPMFQDLTGHGTGIASIISGNGEKGVIGVNPNAEVYSVKVLDENNAGPLSRIIRGIYWCIENDINIINMSFGTSTYSKALEQAVDDAYDAGLLMIGAAGNGAGDVEYPAAFDKVMAVAATNTEAEISDFSNTGEELDIAAPGEKIKVSSFFNGNTVVHGTSIAVPHVTGVASLLWEKDMTKSNEFIRQLIKSSAKDIAGIDECGLIDSEFALRMYRTFEENFDETQIEQKVEIENTEEPENFEYVNDDDAYVEGRWGGADHEAAVNKASAGFTTDEIKVIKLGAVLNQINIDKPNPYQFES